MLNKSNTLYTDLLEKHKSLNEKYLILKGDKTNSKLQSFQIANIKPKNKINRKQRKDIMKEKRARDDSYLKGILLQFFSVDLDSERLLMIPIILELVGCNKEQIAVVTQQYERKKNLLSRNGLFGL